MNLLVIPYHDYRKIKVEGARTRDAHFISHLEAHEEIENLIVINRPLTYLELVFKKKNERVDGIPLITENGCTLYKISDKKYVVDFLFFDFIGPVVKKKEWFFDSFGSNIVWTFIEKCLSFLKIGEYKVLNQNIFSYKLNARFNESNVVFDAWDNFLMFPSNSNIINSLKQAYLEMSKSCFTWITNSPKNVSYFTKYFDLNQIILIRNGVDYEKFQKEYELPRDLAGLPRPIIGFGGKITHLFDFELYNFCLDAHKDKSFVIVGQILDKDVFSKIKKTSNFFYLGDKPYDVYPGYVCNFNVGVIPYVNNHLDSGADTIKAYEYLAANLSTVGTLGAGMTEHGADILIGRNNEEFSKYINIAISQRGVKVNVIDENSWKFKADQIVKILNRKINMT